MYQDIQGQTYPLLTLQGLWIDSNQGIVFCRGVNLISDFHNIDEVVVTYVKSQERIDKVAEISAKNRELNKDAISLSS